MTRKFKIGERVFVASDVNEYATVVHHGYDGSGIYTEVQYDDGRLEKVHRSMLYPTGAAKRCGLQHLA